MWRKHGRLRGARCGIRYDGRTTHHELLVREPIVLCLAIAAGSESKRVFFEQRIQQIDDIKLFCELLGSIECDPRKRQ